MVQIGDVGGTRQRHRCFLPYNAIASFATNYVFRRFVMGKFHGLSILGPLSSNGLIILSQFQTLPRLSQLFDAYSLTVCSINHRSWTFPRL